MNFYFSHTGCPNMAKWPHFGAKIKIYGYNPNIGSREKFFLCDVVHSLDFFQNWIDQANQRIF